MKQSCPYRDTNGNESNNSFQMKYFKTILLILLLPVILYAQIPKEISTQGILTDSLGNKIDGTQQITFKIYDSDTGVNFLWDETQSVYVNNGIFNVILGRQKPFNLSFDKPYWIGVSLNGNELSPRISLSASAYSLNAISVEDRAITTLKIADGTVVRSINGKKDNIEIIPGIGININNTEDKKITITATGGSGVGSLDDSYKVGRSITADNGAVWIKDVGGLIVDGNIGIGKTPTEKLDIAGTAKMTGLILPTNAQPGYVLTSDGSGNASWQAVSGGLSPNSVNTNHIINGAVTSQKLADKSVTAAKIADDAVVKSLNGKKNDVEIISANSNLTIDNSGTKIIMTATGGGSDVGSLQQTYDVGYTINTSINRPVTITGTGGLIINGSTVGIGTLSPDANTKLDVNGTLKMLGFLMPTGAPNGYVLTTDSYGNGTWQQLGSAIPDNSITGSKINIPLILQGTNDLYIIYAKNKVTTGGGAIKGENDNGTYGFLGSPNEGAGGVNSSSGNFGSLGRANEGVYGLHNSTGNYGYIGSTDYGVYGKHNSSGNFGLLGSQTYGIYGYCSSSTGTGVYGVNNYSGNYGRLATQSEGVYGSSNLGDGVYGSSGSGNGVKGKASSSGYGVYGDSQSGYGVYGKQYTFGNYGYLGSTNYGVYGEGISGTGVYGYHNTSGNFGFLGSTDYSVYGKHNSSGNYGYLGSTNYGVYGYCSSGNYGTIGSSSCGVWGNSLSGLAVFGESQGGYGMYGFSNSGIAGYFNYDNQYSSTLGCLGYAAKFTGDVQINGRLSKSSGSFKIDHPLDPENKYLYHSFVESPDMMNIYNGNAVLDNSGEAWIELPDYFEALNKDFRYQLTCIGGFAQVYIAEEIKNNRFKIAGGKSGLKVSWQVTGIRHDPYADKNRIVVEEEKNKDEKGLYIYPELYGKPESKGIGWERRNEDMQRMKIESERMKKEQEKENEKIKQ